MPILDAALAFALTMLVVASAVTLIVSVLRNSAAVRTETLKEMLNKFYYYECRPVIEHEAIRISKEVDQQVADLLRNSMKDYNIDAILKTVHDEKLPYLSTQDLLEYIKRTTLGTTLLRELGDKADEVFDKLGKRYEAIGARFTESFRKKSRFWTTIVALIVALVFNIDSVFLLDSYLKDESLRQGIVAQMDVIVDQYTATIAKIPADEAGGNDNAAVVGATDDTPQETTGDTGEEARGNAALGAADDDAVVTKEALEQSIKDTKVQIDLLKSSGFPIGRSYFPHGCWGEDTADCTARNNGGGWFWWILGIVLTTGLAGLGAPFWYDAIRGISSIAQQAGKSQKATQK